MSLVGHVGAWNMIGCDELHTLAWRYSRGYRSCRWPAVADLTGHTRLSEKIRTADEHKAREK